MTDVCTDPRCWVTVHRVLDVPHYHEFDPFDGTYDAIPVHRAEPAAQPPLPWEEP